MQCSACGKELSKRDALFTEKRLPYCPNPFDCNEDHPNSVKNILARKDAVKMYSEDELESSIFENLNVSDEVKKRITRIASKPQSIRIPKVELAYYLLKLQEYHGLPSIAEAVRYCIEATMDGEPIDDVELSVNEESSDDVPTPMVIPVIKKPSVTIMPRVNVKDVIMNQIDQKEEEDDLVF